MKQDIANKKPLKIASAKNAKPRRSFSLAQAHRQEQKSAVPIGITLVFVASLLVIVIVVATKTSAGSWMKASGHASPATGGSASSDDKWKELDGMSMAEWMKKNNVKSQMMEERKERLHQHQSGKQSQ